MHLCECPFSNLFEHLRISQEGSVLLHICITKNWFNFRISNVADIGCLVWKVLFSKFSVLLSSIILYLLSGSSMNFFHAGNLHVLYWNVNIAPHRQAHFLLKHNTSKIAVLWSVFLTDVGTGSYLFRQKLSDSTLRHKHRQFFSFFFLHFLLLVLYTSPQFFFIISSSTPLVLYFGLGQATNILSPKLKSLYICLAKLSFRIFSLNSSGFPSRF